MRTCDPRSGGAQGVDGRYNAWRSGAPGPRAPWTVTRSSRRMLRRVTAFCRPLRPVFLVASFPRSRSPVVGVPGLCWLRQFVR